jgi:hypothetical protein
MKQHSSRLEAFLSLEWYEIALRFLFTFVAKTSEILLAAGLTVSTVNFLTDGSVLAAYPGVSQAWAWAQAIAIDSSLGVCLRYTFEYLKQHDWIKGVLYGFLTLLLAVVAGAVTMIDIVSHALHISLGTATMQIGVNVTTLSRLRAVAVVGFLLMSRVRDLPFKELATKEEAAPDPSLALAKARMQPERVQSMVQFLLEQCPREEVAQVINACLASRKLSLVRAQAQVVPAPLAEGADHESQSHDGTQETQEHGAVEPTSHVAPELQGRMEQHDQRGSAPPSPVRQEQSRRVPQRQVALEQDTGPDPSPDAPRALQQHTSSQQDTLLGQEERLEEAYRTLISEGKTPSGRALAQRAHIHRSTCVEWLRAKQQQAPESQQQGEGHPAPESASEAPALPSPAREMDPPLARNDASPDVSPDYGIPEDTPAP